LPVKGCLDCHFGRVGAEPDKVAEGGQKTCRFSEVGTDSQK
jgi:hypothetical protein